MARECNCSKRGNVLKDHHDIGCDLYPEGTEERCRNIVGDTRYGKRTQMWLDCIEFLLANPERTATIYTCRVDRAWWLRNRAALKPQVRDRLTIVL